MAAGFRDIFAMLLGWSSRVRVPGAWSLAASEIYLSGVSQAEVCVPGTAESEIYLAGAIASEIMPENLS